MKAARSKITLTEVHSEKGYKNAATLFKAYARELGVDLEFQNFNNELKNIVSEYRRPHGAIIIAVKNEKEHIGCVAIRKFKSNICELKRMYIKKEARGWELVKCC